MRNHLFDRGYRKIHSAGVTVISVGNLTVGGTGKTPMVALLADAAKRADLNPAILTRGYRPRGQADQESDEVLLYSQLVPEVPVIVEGDRVAGAARAVAGGARLLLLDDGFQHRRIARDVDLVLVDARDPFGGDRLLPAGRLREPVLSLRRASAVCLTRCGRADREQVGRVRQAIRVVRDDLPVMLSDHRPAGLLFHGSGELAPLDQLEGKKVLVVSGIGDPMTLSETLQSLGALPVRTLDYGDHHPYGDSDLSLVAREAEKEGVELVVTTEKDLMRMPTWSGSVPLGAIRIEVELLEDGASLMSELVGFSVS